GPHPPRVQQRGLPDPLAHRAPPPRGRKGVLRVSPTRPYGGVSAERRVADRRERLLEAALEDFGTRGVAATGVKDICRRAGLTDRYFYESFRDSGELFTAVCDRATTHLF